MPPPTPRHLGVSFVAAAALVAAAILSYPRIAGAAAADNPVRRFQVELQILAGDARALVQPGTSTLRRHGLSARIAHSLGTLRFLARQYLQARGRDNPDLLRSIERLRHAFAAGRLRELAAASADLAHRYPLDLAGLRPADARPADIAAGRHIYRTLCMGCHEHPDTSSENPAPNLFTMARRLPPREFIARLLGGVHGTPAVALHNPFTDAEIAGLAAYLAAAPTMTHGLH